MPDTAAMQRRSGANRERLVNAAAALFWSRGYDGASLADIARQSGVPLGNVYYYFKTKAAIAEAVGQLLMDQTRAALTEIEADHVEPRARLGSLFVLFSVANEARAERGCPIAAACQGFRGDAPEAARLAAGAFQLMQDWIADNLVDLGMDRAVAQGQADIWMALWQGGIALAHGLEDKALLDRMTDRLIAEAARVNPRDTL